MNQTVYLQSAHLSSHSQSMSPYWSTLQITISILLNNLKCELNKMNKKNRILSERLINKLINIENVRPAPRWLMNIALPFL